MANKDNEEAPCTPFFVKVAVLTPDDQHEIHFGISKSCNADNTATWSISFVLMELRGGKMTTRVEIEAQVGPENAAAMEKLAGSRSRGPDRDDPGPSIEGPKGRCRGQGNSGGYLPSRPHECRFGAAPGCAPGLARESVCASRRTIRLGGAFQL